MAQIHELSSGFNAAFGQGTADAGADRNRRQMQDEASKARYYDLMGKAAAATNPADKQMLIQSAQSIQKEIFDVDQYGNLQSKLNYLRPGQINEGIARQNAYVEDVKDKASFIDANGQHPEEAKAVDYINSLTKPISADPNNWIPSKMDNAKQQIAQMASSLPQDKNDPNYETARNAYAQAQQDLAKMESGLNKAKTYVQQFQTPAWANAREAAIGQNFAKSYMDEATKARAEYEQKARTLDAKDPVQQAELQSAWQDYVNKAKGVNENLIKYGYANYSGLHDVSSGKTTAPKFMSEVARAALTPSTMQSPTVYQGRDVSPSYKPTIGGDGIVRLPAPSTPAVPDPRISSTGKVMTSLNDYLAENPAEQQRFDQQKQNFKKAQDMNKQLWAADYLAQKSIPSSSPEPATTKKKKK